MRTKNVTTALGFLAAAVFLAGSITSQPLRAQSAQVIDGATPVGNDLVKTSLLLGTTIKREAKGFSLTPPAGSRTIEKAGADLVSFVVDAKSWGGSLERLTSDKPVSLPDFVETNTHDLSKTFRGVQVLEKRVFKRDKKDAAIVRVSMQAELGSGFTQGMLEKMGTTVKTKTEIVDLYRQQFIFKNRDNQLHVLTFYTPLKDRDVATQTFDAMLSELEIFDMADVAAQRVADAKLGKEWLAKRSAEEFATKIENQTQRFSMMINGDDVGCIRFDEQARETDSRGNTVDVTRDGRHGVLFTATFASFPPSGNISSNSGKVEAFWAYSHGRNDLPAGQYSLWNNISKTAQKGAPPGSVIPWLQETGVILQDPPTDAKSIKPYHLTVTFTGGPSQSIPTEALTGNVKSAKIIGGTRVKIPDDLDVQVPMEAPAPLPKVLEYTWPRFVDLTKPSEMTFAVYSSTENKIVLLNLIVSGKRENIIIRDGKAMTCFKCVNEIESAQTILWVDAAGRIQMMKTSDQTVMVPATAEEIEAKWGPRLTSQ